MIKILNSANSTLATLNNVPSAEISEEINGAFIFNFTAVIDGAKSAEIYHGHKVEIEDNYFNIMKTVKKRTMGEITISAACEHVSYDFIDVVYTAGFTATGLASATLTTLISAVNTAITATFTLGSVTTTSSATISINESVTARGVLLALAAAYGGELKFDKYAVSLLSRRGADRGVQFRYRKNISEAAVTVDYQALQDDGSPTVTYEVAAAELEYEQSYIDKGYSSLEHYELGDTIRVLDDDLDIDTSARIVKNTYDPLQRMQGNVEIGHYVNDLTNTLTKIKTTTVAKNGIYNGTSIGPDDGFVATRSDELVKTEMNATNGIEIDLRPSTTASYTPVFYVTVNTATGTANLYLAGDAVFTGNVLASTIEGSTIIGSLILAGTTSIATAPFSATESGAVTCNNITITGGLFNIGTGTNTLQFNTTNGLYLGATAFSTAPFKVTMSGAVTASNLDMTGGNITGGNITITSNATIGNVLYLDKNNIGNGILWGNPDIAEIYIDPGSNSLFLRADGNVYANNVQLDNGVSGTIRTTAAQTITVTDGIITNIV